MDNLTKGTIRYNNKQIDDAPYTRERTGIIKASGVDGYTAEIDGALFTNIPVLVYNTTPVYSVNDTVVIKMPNNQTSNMYILGKLG